MKHLRRNKLAIALVVLLAFTMVACDDSDHKKVAKATDTIASSLGTAQSVNKILYEEGKITASEARGIANLLLDSNTAVESFIAKAKSLKELDKDNKALMAQWVAELAAELRRLNEEGILHIKNPEARSRLSVIFASIEGVIQVMSPLFVSVNNRDNQGIFLDRCEVSKDGVVCGFVTIPCFRTDPTFCLDNSGGE